jgi:signal transduction histidine kinase
MLAGSHNVIQFSISDTGIGIPASKLSPFDAFSQEDSSITRKFRHWFGIDHFCLLH